jgi:5-(carboxyamino)imidazole ribonucleotide synthase
MEKHFYNGKKVGILGGGQLGRMLIQAGIDLNLHISVLDPDENAPCRPFCHHFVQGSFADYDTVLEFGRSVDLITIEIEHVNVEALEVLEKEGKEVYPSPAVIRIVQDKGLQKEFYRDNNIPTAAFELVDSADEIIKFRDILPVFQKLRKSGYDGRGVQAINSIEDISKGLSGPSIIEKRIEYQKEIAVIVGRSKDGAVSTFPLVDMVLHPEKNLLSYLISPAELSEEIYGRAESLAKKVAEAIGLVGIMAVEMFLLPDGDLLVNEVAPRPHNSGHQTIEGNITSQYAQLWRAVLGLPLGSTETILPSGMINLLGEEGYSGEAFYEGIESAMALPGVYIHLYGKSHTKPFRKMGHVTITANSIAEVHAFARKVEALVRVKAL